VVSRRLSSLTWFGKSGGILRQDRRANRFFTALHAVVLRDIDNLASGAKSDKIIS